jgi:transketolase
MLQESLDAAEMLFAEKIDVEIINIHTLKPIDSAAIVKSAKKTGVVVTAENHNVIGGLYSAVCEILIREKCFVPVKAIGINDVFGQVGKLDYLKKIYNMTAKDIAGTILKLLHNDAENEELKA